MFQLYSQQIQANVTYAKHMLLATADALPPELPPADRASASLRVSIALPITPCGFLTTPVLLKMLYDLFKDAWLLD